MITLPEYNTQIKHKFVIPRKPGVVLPVPLPGATLAHIYQINWVHGQSLQLLQTYVNNNQVIKQQLQKEFYGIYLSAIKDYITSYIHTRIHEIILHLYQIYVTVDNFDNEKNNVRMIKPYDLTKPITILFV